MESQILTLLAQSGPSGIIAAIILLIWWRESKRHETEMRGVIEAYRQIAIDNTRAITHLTTIMERFMDSEE